MPTLFWDMETRSAANLRDSGAAIYAIDPTTQVLCLVYAIDDGEPQIWLPGNVLNGENTRNSPPTVFLKIAANPTDWQLVAHNYDFEREIYNNILVAKYGFRPIPLVSQH